MNYEQLPRDVRMLILLWIHPTDIYDHLKIPANFHIITDEKFWKNKALYDLQLSEIEELENIWNLPSKLYSLNGYRRYVRTLAFYNIPTRDVNRVLKVNACINLAILHKNLKLLAHFCGMNQSDPQSTSPENQKLYESSLYKMGRKFNVVNNNLLECIDYEFSGNSTICEERKKLDLGIKIAKGEWDDSIITLAPKDVIDIAINYGQFNILETYLSRKQPNVSSVYTGWNNYIKNRKLDYYVKNGMKEEIIKILPEMKTITVPYHIYVCKSSEIIRHLHNYIGIRTIVTFHDKRTSIYSLEYCKIYILTLVAINTAKLLEWNPLIVYTITKNKPQLIKEIFDSEDPHPINIDLLYLLPKFQNNPILEKYKF